ncbi:MAG: exosortase family protein XrtF [Cyclobacteriaceae bacterium]|nr:exosortase family protein XrtF [Cyclobacteriaceae bacterium]
MSNTVHQLFTDNKPSILFLVKFVVLYFILNTLYGLYIEWYSPQADPLTWFVSNNTRWLLSIFHDQITISSSGLIEKIAIQRQGITVINMFEGCNSINVMIVFVVFIVAFSNQWYRSWKFILFGLVAIYVVNLARVAGLFWVSYYFPGSFYLFHKYLFTGLIYIGVFILWYYWIKKIRKHEPGNRAA